MISGEGDAWEDQLTNRNDMIGRLRAQLAASEARCRELEEYRDQLIRDGNILGAGVLRLREALVACSPAWLPEGIRKMRQDALRESGEDDGKSK